MGDRYLVWKKYTKECLMASRKENRPTSIYELWSLVDQAVFAVSRLREIELDQVGLTLAQSSILSALNMRGGSATLQELEKNGMRQHHSVSTLINRMTEMGLVSKVKGPNDKRYKIAITKEGEELRSKTTYISLEMTFSILSAEEKQQLIDNLVVLLDRSRYLLGMSQSAPFLQHLKNKDEKGKFERNKADQEANIDYFLWTLFDRFGFAITRLRELELAQIGLTVPQAAILHALTSHGGEMTLQELEERRMRQHHSIFILINRMIKMGLITQEKNTQDKRFKIRITKEGQEAFNKETTASLEMTFSVLTPEQRQQVGEAMRKVLERARYLLGISYVPPFLQYLIYGENKAVT
jgi:DNA-binding MarR family transcriptional regulator